MTVYGNEYQSMQYGRKGGWLDWYTCQTYSEEAKILRGQRVVTCITDESRGVS